MKVILFGASGNLGKKKAAKLKLQQYDFTAVVRNQKKADELSGDVNNCLIADVTNQSPLKRMERKN